MALARFETSSVWWFDLPEQEVATELERRVATAPNEMHRPHGADGGAGCVGCAWEHDFWCVGCDRWRCWCTGGGDEAVVTRALCSDCWRLYRDARLEHEAAFVRLLQAQLARLVPASWLQARVSLALVRLLAHRRHALPAVRRRMSVLGWRTVKRMSLRQQLGLVVLTWPSLDIDCYRWTEGLWTAATQVSGWSTYGYGKFRRIEVREALERWAESLEAVLSNWSLPALLPRAPELVVLLQHGGRDPGTRTREERW